MPADELNGRRYRKPRVGLIRIGSSCFRRRRTNRWGCRRRESVNVFETRDFLRAAAVVKDLKIGNFEIADRVPVGVAGDDVYSD